MSLNFSSEDDLYQISQYMKLIGESPYIFVHHKDITFAAYVVNHTSISISQIEVRVHPGVQTDLSSIEEIPNISLFTILSLIYEAELDSQVGENGYNLDELRNSYRIFLKSLLRNLFFAVEHRDRWGDYIDPFLFELADAIL